MKWFLMTIIAGWGGVDPTTALGSVLIVITQLIAIMLAAILTGVVATAYNAKDVGLANFHERDLVINMEQFVHDVTKIAEETQLVKKKAISSEI